MYAGIGEKVERGYAGVVRREVCISDGGSEEGCGIRRGEGVRKDICRDGGGGRDICRDIGGSGEGCMQDCRCRGGSDQGRTICKGEGGSEEGCIQG